MRTPNPAHARQAARFRGLSETLARTIEQKRAPLSQNWTPRRGAIKEGQLADAERLDRVRLALDTLADRWEAGTMPLDLVRVLTRQEVERLLDPHEEARQRGNAAYAFRNTRAALLAVLEEVEDTPEARAKREQVEQAKAEALRARRLRELRIPGFFPSPPEVVGAVVDELQLEAGPMRILEPSAGAGHLAEPLAAHVEQWSGGLVLVERSPSLMEHLAGGSEKVFLICADFLEIRPETSGRFDRVAMNPPFEKRQGIAHVAHAVRFLAEGGRLVAVLPPHHAQECADTHGGHVVELPEGSFTGAESIRQTNVRTALVVIDR